MNKEIEKAFYSYASSCFTDNAVFKALKASGVNLDIDKIQSDDVVEIMALAGEQFHKFYKLSK